VVNKKQGLPADYVPKNLVTPNLPLRLSGSDDQMKTRADIQDAWQAMFAAAKKDNVELVFGSGYRSGKLQKEFYDKYVRESGQEAADTFSARPGHSEHQTGLVSDITRRDGKCHLEICFAETEQGQWLKAHAHEYGFIVRYLEGKQAITGYQYEPWHTRYVGKELAGELHKTGQTMEEFFGLGAAAQY
jgi:D-alanyl-D-alanine carboxypeptidase